jgi:phosphatidylglycerol---prolipoprotein diacylglyceryl transferase
MSLWVRVTYGCILITSLIVASLLVRSRQRRLPITASQKWALGVSAFIGAMLGAKVPFLWERGWDGIFDGTAWFADGKTILGGIAGGYVAVEIMKRLMDIRTKTGDTFALPIAIAVGIGRVGCFVAGCCFGRVTAVPWGIRFENAGDEAGIFRHPTQLYEAAFHFVSAILLYLAYRQKWFLGNQLKAYLLCYMAFRFVTEWFRPESPALFDLTVYQLICVLFAAILVALWIKDMNTTLLVTPDTTGK